MPQRDLGVTGMYLCKVEPEASHFKKTSSFLQIMMVYILD